MEYRSHLKCGTCDIEMYRSVNVLNSYISESLSFAVLKKKKKVLETLVVFN